MCLTYPLSGVVFGTFISSRVWDYALTVTLLHVALSCLVMLSFPTNWSWWLCLGGSCVVMILCGEGVAGLRRYRNSSRLVVPEKQPETISYLHR
ncbi:transmembrane protein 244-like [Mya arenaria]|uniref:transmembrane protein 244-like n=1 Tax=Mya arenaria TaxID=6604 RepID=UPI0022E37E8F|nr:transmembrane protein 244-like [Mya arenaria]